MSEPRRIILSEDDFDAPAAPATDTAQPPPAAPPPLPPVARRPPVSISDAPAVKSKAGIGAGPALMHDERTAGLVAAGVGMLIAWAITELLQISSIDATSKLGSDAVAALWTGVVAAVFCSVVLGFDRAVAGAWPEAWRRAGRVAPRALGIGFAAGFVANVVFLEVVQSIVERSGGFVGEHDARVYVARALFWTVAGGGIGVIVGLTERSRAKAINGLLGGLGGGAVGGLLFQFTAAVFDAGGLSRLIGLLGIGLLVAAATRAVEHARREAWLRVITGGMAGKEFILYHPVTHIGSAPECDIFLLKDPAVAPHHARIEDRGTERLLHSTAGAPVLVNQAPVSSRRLRGGDQIQIGNSTIAYSERHVTATPGRTETPWT